MSDKDTAVSEEYIQLAFAVDYFLKDEIHEDTIVVDSYFGPPELQPEKQPQDPDLLRQSIQKLTNKVKDQILVDPQRTFLLKQLDALNLLVSVALGEKVSFEHRVRVGLDIDVVTILSERIDELAEEAERALRKEVLKGNLTTMASRWRKRAMTTGSEIIPLARDVAVEARRSTQRLLFKLPETEHIEFRAVSEAPWSAYNHYQGNFHAIIEVNTDLPRSRYSIWKWVTHETYPGHQTHLVQRELGYQQNLQNLEATITIINSPDCTLAEGLAEAGPAILSSARPLTKPEIISSYLLQLRRAVGINALVMFHQEQRNEKEVLDYIKDLGAYEQEYAEARLPFMKDIMWGPYSFTYFVGAWLVGGFFKAAKEANIIDEFVTALYHELHTPSTLKSRITALNLTLPPKMI